MKKLLALLIAGAFAVSAFANEASAPSHEHEMDHSASSKHHHKKHSKKHKKHASAANM